MSNSQKLVPFPEVIEALLDSNRPFSPVHLHRFSDLEGKDLASLAEVWSKIAVSRRINLLKDLEELAQSDSLVNFDSLSMFTLKDENDQCRELGIRLLWDSEDSRLIPEFIRMMENDESMRVRAAAASALGLFVYLGELEEHGVSEKMLKKVEDALFAVVQGKEDAVVRRCALEALGYSSHDDVPGFIQKAFQSSDPSWQISALMAMGRSADRRWEKSVMKMITNPNPDLQEQAVKSAGELELQAARTPLLRFIGSTTTDENVWLASIWALSQIGGEDVRETFEKLLAEAEDDDEIQFIEDAIDNLEFTQDYNRFDIMDFDAADKSHLGGVVDLEKPQEDEEE